MRKPLSFDEKYGILKVVVIVAALLSLFIFAPRLLKREITLTYESNQTSAAEAVLARWTLAYDDPPGGCWLLPSDSNDSAVSGVAVPANAKNIRFFVSGALPVGIRVTDSVMGRVSEVWVKGITPSKWDPVTEILPEYFGEPPQQRFMQQVTMPQHGRSTVAYVIGVLAILFIAAVFFVPWRLRYATTETPPLPARRWWITAIALVAAVKIACTLTMPLIWSGDSVEYGVVATTFHETGSLGSINAWRMPGYSVLLGLGLHIATIQKVVAILHTLCGLITALAAGALAARVLPHMRLAGPIVLVLVGIDPTCIMYERMVLTESITSASFMLATWLTMLAVKRVRWSSAYGLVAASVLVLALASLVRSNMQVFLVLLPVIAVCARARRDRVWRTGGTIAAAIIVTTLVLGPRLNNMSAAYNTKALAIGTGFTRMFGLTDARLVELNNASAFTPTQWKAAVDRSTQPWFTGYELLNCINTNSRLGPRYSGLKPWPAADASSAELADETVRRHGPSTLLYSTKAFANLLGFPVSGGSMFRENQWWFQRFASNPIATPALTNWWDDPAGFAHLDPARVQSLADTTRRPIDGWSHSIAAKAFGGWNTAITQIRPLIAAGSLFGLFVLVYRGKPTLAILLATPIIHHAVLAFHLFSGIDRYAAPFYPVMWIAFAAAFAIWRPTHEASHETTVESAGVAGTGAERPVK